MTVQVSPVSEAVSAPPTNAKPFPTVRQVYQEQNKLVLPGGFLSLSGTVYSNGAEAFPRIVRLYDRETGELISETSSGAGGTYIFTNLTARSEGYNVVMEGIIGSGERDVIIPGVNPA